MLTSPALPLRCSQEAFEFAVSEVLKQHDAALFPADAGNGLTADERQLLLEGGADLDAHDHGADDPVLRAAAKRAAILAASLTTAEAAARLGVTEMRIRQRLTAGSLRGVQTSRGWRLPSFQFSGDGELPGWDQVAKALPLELSVVTLLSWLELPNTELRAGKKRLTPLAWLASGREPAAVVAICGQLELW
jgi:excisionase family DNA binding protein